MDMMTDDTGNQNDQGTKLPIFDGDLFLFIDTCISLGITSLEDLSTLVNDYALSQRILVAAQHNPLKGSRTNAELLEQELRGQAMGIPDLDDSLSSNGLLKEIK
jgi:hypothetical protein